MLPLSYSTNRSTPTSLWNAIHSRRYDASSLKIAQTAILSMLSAGVAWAQARNIARSRGTKRSALVSSTVASPATSENTLSG